VRENGALTLALTLARHGRTLRSLGIDHTPRFDCVGDARELPALWRAIARVGNWDTLELRGFPADSPLSGMAELARAEGFRACTSVVSRAPWFYVRGIEENIHRRFRGDMRRLERQLGGVELERFSCFDRSALRDFFRIEASGWKGAAGSAIACDPRLVAHYTVLARLFARRGKLTLAFLRARGERIAACFALEDATTFYLVKVAYDPQYAHYGPGQLLVRETAFDAERRGLTRYDLLGKDTAYKMKWTDRVRPHLELRIYAPSPGGRARYWAREVARPMAGRLLRTLRLYSRQGERGSTDESNAGGRITPAGNCRTANRSG
jgi:CelD/BcsL family acetyltransferase involved in cellulose biosynthesis